MSTLQAIWLGMMIAWTPSLALLAWIIWRDDYGREPHRAPERIGRSDDATQGPRC
jgi:hypothetical protein